MISSNLRIIFDLFFNTVLVGGHSNMASIPKFNAYKFILRITIIVNNSFCKSELKQRVMEPETKLIVSFNYAS